MDYLELLKELQQASDEKYRLFNESLIPGVQKTYGVRIPWLRKKAKELAKDWEEFLCQAKEDTHEEIMLQGLVMGYAKCSYEQRLALLRKFVPKIHNWAVCDTVCATLKEPAKDLSRFREFLTPYMTSQKEFEKRFAIVCLMDYFLTEEYIDEVLEYLSEITHPGYYVKMAAAWALSLCFVKFRDKTLAYFTQGKMKDPWTHKKAIQKCRESYRVSPEDKELLTAYPPSSIMGAQLVRK